MDHADAAAILNRHVLSEGKAALLETIALYPDRFVGLFRPTKPRAKIIQHLLQSNEIRFGDAIEELIRSMIEWVGFTNEATDLAGPGGNTLSLDQYFRKGNEHYFIEQKVRDDHDSTKKRGQIDNFEKKIEVLVERHGSNLRAGMYFVDPSQTKNRRYYQAEIDRLREFWDIEIVLHYGGELFAYLGAEAAWDCLLEWLWKWRQGLPDLPEVNFDLDPSGSCELLWGVERRVWRRALQNDQLWEDGVLGVLFPTGETLRLMVKRLRAAEDAASRSLEHLIGTVLGTRYGSGPADRRETGGDQG